jgi:hypothetical protein
VVDAAIYVACMNFPWKKKRPNGPLPALEDYWVMSLDEMMLHAQGQAVSSARRIELVASLRAAQAQVRATSWQRWSTVITAFGILVALFQHH